ncbi:hypothetical protein [Mycoplasmopsis cynos]|nr:hypothetical protein [Mycoplasmopsis cynos]UWV76984.1 hypothetical protein NW070_04180 [Mycoplasmopsis cynos]UWV81120.1 hypothetical protein NW065_03905 [Mycoplasmopsis cynos]WAM04883.1 hypothetical protein ONA01_01575 [Mycoplasmopsis cynos]WAM07338.1 hypothetical protein ONA21_03970 [Mycoplasmopsis cynos]
MIFPSLLDDSFKLNVKCLSLDDFNFSSISFLLFIEALYNKFSTFFIGW